MERMGQSQVGTDACRRWRHKDTYPTTAETENSIHRTNSW